MATLYFPLTEENQPEGYRSSSFVHFACFPEIDADEPAHNLILPLPQSFSVADGMNYGTTDLQSRDVQDGLFNQAASNLKDKKLSFTDNLADAVLGAGATELGLRKITNPNTHTTFEGVNLRDFSFSFSLVPRNQADAEMINRIRKTFQIYAYPENKDSGTFSRAFLKFPAIWDVSIIFTQQQGNLNKYIPQILPQAYIISVGQTVNPEANTYHKDGQPTAITLDIGIREARTLTRAEIESLDDTGKREEYKAGQSRLEEIKEGMKKTKEAVRETIRNRGAANRTRQQEAGLSPMAARRR